MLSLELAQNCESGWQFHVHYVITLNYSANSHRMWQDVTKRGPHSLFAPLIYARMPYDGQQGRCSLRSIFVKKPLRAPSSPINPFTRRCEKLCTNSRLINFNWFIFVRIRTHPVYCLLRGFEGRGTLCDWGVGTLSPGPEIVPQLSVCAALFIFANTRSHAHTSKLQNRSDWFNFSPSFEKFPVPRVAGKRTDRSCQS